MMLMKRGHEGWVWPKTVLDFATYGGISRQHLDAITDALAALLGERGIGVTIQDVLVYGEDQITTSELIFEVHAPPSEMQSMEALEADWSAAIIEIAPRCIYYPQLSILPEAEAPEP